MNVIQSTWAFKLKQFLDGLVQKLKSRTCLQGDQQIEGVIFLIMFMLLLQMGLASTQVDYVSAFCQAPMEEDVYISISCG